jgi:Mg-chelatase subunit ChlD
MAVATKTPSIPLADAGQLRHEGRRTTGVQVALAVALAALGLAAFLVARGLAHRPGAVSSPRAGGVLVLDLSSSVGPSSYRRIRRTLARLTERRERLGVVIFSDTAYEVLPPGTQPVELGPIARFFKPHAVPSSPTPFPPRLIENPRFYENPWSTSYHGGTQISTGLDLAQRILERNHIEHGRVILISDLNESNLDQPRLTRTLLAYAQRRTKLEVVDLSRGDADRRLYSQLTGRSVTLTEPALPRVTSSRPSPWWLVGVGLGLALLLAVNEHWCRRLSWRPRSVEPP